MTMSVSVSKVSAPLPWQAEIWLRLNQQLAGGQLPHALLLTGPEYTGKSRLALALARLLLCARPVGGLNCGECHPCELSASGNHGDFQWLEPEGKGRVVKIEQIRKLVEFAGRTAGFGLRKVVVIAPAENMNISAANALLKVLEEPPANTHLLLVSHRPHGLPATIRSRCQILRPALPDRQTSLAWLDPLCGSREQAERMLDLAGLRPLLAAQLHAEASGERLEAARLAMQAVFNGRAATSALAAALAGEDLQPALAQLAGGIGSLLRNLDGAALASRQARDGFALLDDIVRIQRAIRAGSNPNPQLLLDGVLANMQRVLGDGGLGDKIGANPGGNYP